MASKLCVKNICYSYGKKKIIDEISFTCENGITAILGNNGAGKTTLMKMITGLQKPASGEIMLNEMDLVRAKKFPVDQVGYLPQNFSFYKNITGYNFLAYVCDIKKIDQNIQKAAIAEVVDTFNLGSVIHKKIGKYSGGFARRLGIAQAVLGKPPLIVIDEPTVGLDPEQRVEFRKYLSEVGKNSITLISTHIIEDVELYSDQIMIIKDHSLLFNGSVKKIIDVSKPYIYTKVIVLTQLQEIQNTVTILEVKRIDENKVKITYMANKELPRESQEELLHERHLAEEVSLENAYVYFQKR